jgi:hypothetical protein
MYGYVYAYASTYESLILGLFCASELQHDYRTKGEARTNLMGTLILSMIFTTRGAYIVQIIIVIIVFCFSWVCPHLYPLHGSTLVYKAFVLA